MQLLRNILSPPNEMHFSIRQRVVSTNAHLLRIDDSKATQQLFLRIVSIQVYWTTLIRPSLAQPKQITSMREKQHFNVSGALQTTTAKIV